MASFRREAGLLGAGVALAVAGFFGVAVHSAVAYQDALSTVRINAHLTEQAATSLGQAVASAAVGTQASGTEMLAALGPVAGELGRVAGGALTAADATRVLSAAENLVTSSGGNLQSTTKAITDLLLVYHLRTSDAASITDTLFQAHSLLGIGTDRLAMMLQRLQPRIVGSGVDMQHLLGIVTLMTPVVGSGTRAMMMVGSILQNLTSPSKSATAAFAALHISVRDASGAFIGFGPTIDKIRDAYLKLADPADRAALLTAVFGRNAAIAKTLVEGGSAAIDAATLALTGQGTAAEAAAIKNKDLGAMIEIIKKSIGDAVTAIGGALVPALSAVFDAVMPVVTGVVQWVQANPGLITGILAVAGAIGALVAGGLVLGPLMNGLGTGMAFLGGPILVIVGGFVLLQRVLSTMPDVLKPLQPLFDALSAAVGVIGPALGVLFSALSDFVAGRSSIEAVGRALGDLGTALTQALGGVLTALGDIAGKVLNWAAGMIPVWAAAFAQWARAFIAWIAPMVPQFLTAIGRFALDVATWVVKQVPVLAKQLLLWGQAFVGWIIPMIGQAIAGLGTWIGQVLDYISGQAPAIAATLGAWLASTAADLTTQLGTWAAAFIDWIGPVLGSILAGLAQVAGGVIDWISRQVPVILDRLGAWAGAFADWALTTALPALIDNLNRMIDDVAAWLGNSDTLGKIARGLVGWLAPFVAWAGTAAVTVVAGIVAFLASEVVTKGPEIASAVLGAGVSILGGIARGIVAHPEIIVGALGLLLAGGVIMATIEGAGALAGGAYALAMRLGDAIGNVIGAAWEGLSTLVVRAAGFAAGLAYAGAMAVGRIIIDAIGNAWEEVATDVGVDAAVGTAGGLAGGIYAGAQGFLGLVAPGLKTSLTRAWAEVEATNLGLGFAAGASAGAAYDAGELTAQSLGRRTLPWPTAVPGGPAPMLPTLENLGRKTLPFDTFALEDATKLEGLSVGQMLMGTIRGAITGGVGLVTGAITGVLSAIGDTVLMILPEGLGVALSEALVGGIGAAAVAVGGAVIALVGVIALAILNPRWVGFIAGAIVGLIGDAVKLAGAAIVGIGSIVGAAMKGIRDAVVAGITAIATDIGQAWDGVTRFIGDFLRNPGGSLIDASKGFAQFVFGDIPHYIHDAAASWVKDAETGFMGIVSGIGDWLGQAASATSDGFNAVDIKVQDGGQQIVASVRDSWESANATASSLAGKMADDVAGRLTAGQAAVDTAMSLVATSGDHWWTDAHDAAVAAMLKTPGDAAAALKQGAAQIADESQRIRDSIAAGFEMKDLPGKIAAAQDALNAAQKSGNATRISDATNALATLQALYKKDLALMPQTVAQQQAALDVAMKNAQADMVAAIATGDPALVLAAKAEMQHVLDQELALQTASRAAGALVPPAFGDGFKGAAPAATTIVASAVSAMTGAMRTAQAEAYGQGNNIVTNLAAGMSGAKHLVATVAGAISKAIANNWVVSSPAEEGPLSLGGGPEGWGTKMVTTMASGMLDGITALKASVGTIAGVFTPFGMAVGVSGPSIGGVTPGGPLFGRTVAANAGGNITVHVYLGDKEIEGAVSKVMFEEERRHAGPATAGSAF